MIGIKENSETRSIEKVHKPIITLIPIRFEKEESEKNNTSINKVARKPQPIQSAITVCELNGNETELKESTPRTGSPNSFKSAKQIIEYKQDEMDIPDEKNNPILLPYKSNVSPQFHLSEHNSPLSKGKINSNKFPPMRLANLKV